MGNNLTNQAIKDSYQGLVQISGSQITDGTGSLIPSLDITASLATSASYATTANNANTANTATFAENASTASLATSASYATNAGDALQAQVATLATTATSASYATTATSASYASTASYAENTTTPTLNEVLTEGSSSAIIPTLSNGVKTGNRTYSDASTGNGVAGANYTISAGGTTTSTLELRNAGGGANIKITGTDSIIATGSITATNGFVGDLTGNADTATSASYALTATSASHALVSDTATSASYALTASYALNGGGGGTQDLESVLTAGNTATSSIELYNVPFNESLILTHQTNGGAVYSGRANSVLWLGINATGQQDFITLGAQSSIGFFGNSTGANFNNEYNWTPTKGWISGSLAVQQAFTASGLIYPTTDGSNGYVMTTNGAGVLSFQPASGGGSAFPYTGSAIISGSLAITGSVSSTAGNVMLGTGNTITATNNNHVVLSSNASISSTNNNASVVGGYGNTISAAGGYFNSIFGGSSNTISQGQHNNIVSSYLSTISSTNNFGLNEIVGGRSATISGTAQNSTILATENGLINGASTNSTLVGGKNNTITGVDNGIIVGSTGSSVQHQNSAVIGGQGLTTTKANEVVVPNLTISGSGAVLTFADGTQMSSSVAGGSSFPYTGSASILGSLDVVVSGVADGYTITSGSFSGSLIDNIGDIYTTTPAVKHVVSLTQAEYDAITTPDANTLYVISGSATTSPFPYTGDAVISGSLELSGSADVFVIANYATLNFADDTSASAGGVPLGGVYRNGNFLQIRIA